MPTTTKRPYAQDTDVSVSRSIEEIKAELAKREVKTFGYAKDGQRVMIAFTLKGRDYRMLIVEPNPQDFPGYRAGNGRWVDGTKQYEQEVRRRWRTLVLYIKAALVLADEQILTAEQALQPFALLPNGRTAGEWLEPQLQHAYETGQMPPLLPMLIAGPRDATGGDA